MMTESDVRRRFLFEDFRVRGQVVRLGDAYRQVLDQRYYDPEIQSLLGQMMAAASLLASTIKFDGSLILQLKSRGRVQLMMAECRNGTDLRAIARLGEDDAAPLFVDGQLAITIEPNEGERYQGIVELVGENLAESIEVYFQRSEQLDTRLWLAADGHNAAGLLLQAMPDNPDRPGLPVSAEDWNRVMLLTDTLGETELVEADIVTLLHRLYHEEQVRVFNADSLRFHCGCSWKRSANAIKFLGYPEAMEILNTEPHIEIDCQFCHRQYHFDRQEVLAVFEKEAPPTGTTLH